MTKEPAMRTHSIRNPAHLWLLFSLSLLSASDFYVALDGNDGWSGRLASPNIARTDGPFATLERAQTAVRELKKNRRNDIEVAIRGGLYSRTKTFILGLEDGAWPGQTISYVASEGEYPVLSASIPLGPWKKADPLRVPETSRGMVFQAEVAALLDLRRAAARPAGLGLPPDPKWQDRILSLYGPKGALPRARSVGFRAVAEGTNQDRNFWMTNMAFAKGLLRAYGDPSGLELRVIPTYYWTMNLLPVARIDSLAGTLTTSKPATYPMTPNHFTDRDSAFLENAPEDLDEEGEWFYDSTTRSVYLYSAFGPPEGIRAPVLVELIRIEGQVRVAEAEDTPVRGLRFRGLAFAHGERMGAWGGSGLGLQHDWEYWDRPSALVRLRAAESCRFEDCRFSDSAHAGIRLDLQAASNLVRGNLFEKLGGTAILLAGYGPGDKDVNRGNQILDNEIQEIGQQLWGSPAIMIWQSGGNLVAHNHIHRVPYAGLVVSGRIVFFEGTRFPLAECSGTVRWEEVKARFGTNPREALRSWWAREPLLHGRGNLIERNDIHQVMQRLGDGNAIYLSDTGTGNRVRENYLHDNTGRYMNAVIRNDDNQHGSTFEGNLIARSGGWGEAFINKGSNHLRNNIVFNLPGNDSHRAYLVLNTAAQRGSTFSNNVFVTRDTGMRILSEQGSNARNPVGSLFRHMAADANLYFNPENSNWAGEFFSEQRPFGNEARSREADPGFVDPTCLETFQFLPGSPALALGIPQPVELSAIGPREPWRSRYIPPSLRTFVDPDRDVVLWRPVRVNLRSSLPGARITFTTNGLEPDESSTRFENPLLIENPCLLRARSFLDGRRDSIGAERAFTAVPGLREDFETIPAGAQSALGSTIEEGGLTARVAEDTAASGRRSLKFTDGPGGKFTFTPYVFYKVSHHRGSVRLSLSIRFEPEAKVDLTCREYVGNRFTSGPTVNLAPGGRLSASGRALTDLAPGAWHRLEWLVPLGEQGKKFNLTVETAGLAPRVFKELPFDGAFHSLTWFGIISLAETRCAFWIDDLRLMAVDLRDE